MLTVAKILAEVTVARKQHDNNDFFITISKCGVVMPLVMSVCMSVCVSVCLP